MTRPIEANETEAEANADGHRVRRTETNEMPMVGLHGGGGGGADERHVRRRRKQGWGGSRWKARATEAKANVKHD